MFPCKWIHFCVKWECFVLPNHSALIRFIPSAPNYSGFCISVKAVVIQQYSWCTIYIKRDKIILIGSILRFKYLFFRWRNFSTMPMELKMLWILSSRIWSVCVYIDFIGLCSFWTFIYIFTMLDVPLLESFL